MKDACLLELWLFFVQAMQLRMSNDYQIPWNEGLT